MFIRHHISKHQANCILPFVTSFSDVFFLVWLQPTCSSKPDSTSILQCIGFFNKVQSSAYTHYTWADIFTSRAQCRSWKSTTHNTVKYSIHLFDLIYLKLFYQAKRKRLLIMNISVFMRKRVESHKCYRLFRKQKTPSYFKEI